MLKSLLLLTALGQFDVVPELLVVGPTTAKVGDKIVITAKTENANAVEFTVIYNGEHDTDSYEVIAQNYCVTQSKVGKYLVIVSAFNQAGSTKYVHRFDVTDKEDDNTPPKPQVVPEGYKGLTKWAYDTAKRNGLKANQVKGIATNLVSLEQSKATGVVDLLRELKEKNNTLDQTIKDSKEIQAFNLEMITKLTEMFKAKDIDTVDDHKKAMKAIGEGLLYVE